MNNEQFEQQLLNDIQSLPKERQPERDLWPGIEVAMSLDKVEANHKGSIVTFAKQPTWFAVAASFFMVAMVAWVNFGDIGTVEVNEAFIAQMALEHEQQKSALLVKFEDQPALTENWQQQLKELDEAANAVKKVLLQEPNNIALLKMLQNVHQQQIDLIEVVHSSKWTQI
jgi:Tfp pilus assembly protein PilO